MDIYTEVRKGLEKYRGERLESIGKDIGVSPRTMYNIKNGVGNPGVLHVQAVFDWLKKHRRAA